jgi:sodium-dependent dicarboxylate transporter 2/3/5
VLSFMMGGAVVPFRSWQYSLVMQYGEAAGIDINFAVFMAFGAIITFGTITAYTLCMKYLFKVDFSNLRDFDPQTLKSTYSGMNKRQTIVLWVNAVVIGVILLASITPSSSFIYQFFNNTLSTAGIYGLGAVFLCVMPLNKKRQPLIGFYEVAAYSVRWEVILMVGAVMAVSSALISDQSGVLLFASAILGPLFEGTGSVGLLLIVVALATLLTNIGSNIGMGAMLIPMVTPFLESNGANAVVVGIALIYMVNMGLILPGASAPAAIIHSNTEWMEPKDIYKTLIFSMVLTLIVAIPVFLLANVIV